MGQVTKETKQTLSVLHNSTFQEFLALGIRIPHRSHEIAATRSTLPLLCRATTESYETLSEVPGFTGLPIWGRPSSPLGGLPKGVGRRKCASWNDTSEKGGGEIKRQKSSSPGKFHQVITSRLRKIWNHPARQSTRVVKTNKKKSLGASRRSQNGKIWV